MLQAFLQITEFLHVLVLLDCPGKRSGKETLVLALVHQSLALLQNSLQKKEEKTFIHGCILNSKDVKPFLFDMILAWHILSRDDHFKASLIYKQGLLYSSPFVFLVQR